MYDTPNMPCVVYSAGTPEDASTAPDVDLVTSPLMVEHVSGDRGQQHPPRSWETYRCTNVNGQDDEDGTGYSRVIPLQSFIFDCTIQVSTTQHNLQCLNPLNENINVPNPAKRQ